jgi:thiosulfate dehydrogenase (quinone) large subunit
MEAILASWRRQSPAIRLLRAFLGVTFIYAGWHKASDPNFIGQGFADSVGAFASSSPISSLLEIALDSPTLFAWAIIAAEIGVGVFTLLGVGALLAALGGILLTLTLWLSTSWNVRPYFLAADPAYLALWSVYALDLYRTRSRRRVVLDRRGFMRGALGAGLIAAIALVAKRTAGPASAKAGGSIPLDQIEVGGAATFESSQGPAVAIRTGAQEVIAFSAKCTHEGCLVNYEGDRKLLVCPCHGATFDPQNQGAHTAPATRPLKEIAVRIDSSGEVVES